MEIGLKREKFGLHSLRSSRATAAANAGVKNRLFKGMEGGDPRIVRTGMLRTI